MLQPTILGPDANAAGGDVSTSGGGHQVFFMPQDRCVQSHVAVGAYTTQEGCAPIGSAGYVVGNLTNHGGSVMHSVTNYAIFWLPPAYHFDTPTIDRPYLNASDVKYEALVGRYFSDLSNTSFYSIVQQYGDLSGAPGLATSFGGSWVDTSLYPNSEGSKANPLQDSDIEAEVAKAMSANGWSAGNGNNAFFVFTGQNVFGCAGGGCSYKDYCAYHSAFQASDGQGVEYADIPDPGSANTGSCLATAATGSAAPNGGAFADSAVNLVAHEGFESVTDPTFDGWYYQDTDHEIGDECIWKFGSVASDGSNVVLNGHRYLVQEMWSNKTGGCYIPQVASTLVVAPSYLIQGGGTGFTPPTFTYFSSGVLKNILLSTTPQTLSVDFGSTWSVTGTLPGSTSTERWQIGQVAAGVLSLGGPLAFTYYHQYLVSVRGGSGGGSAQSHWFNSSTQATVTTPGVYARNLGLGLRVTGYQVDGGPLQVVAPTVGQASVVLQMDGPHVVDFSTATQYQVSLDLGASAALLSITPPTVPGDTNWYDSGSRVTLVLNGVWGRDSSSGNRLVSYTTDGGMPVDFTTANSVAVMQSVQISSPHSVTAVVTIQHPLSTKGGSVQSSTAPSVPGDAGWYDSGSKVSVVYDHVWNKTVGTRMNALGITVDGIPGQVSRSGTGAFQESVVMDRAHILDVVPVVQYQLSVSGGSAVAVAPQSPTGDEFYDSGSSVSVSSARAWDVTALSREALVSFSIDGGGNETLNPLNGSGSFSTPSITFARPHQVVFGSATQYLIGFRFTDALGTRTIVPTSLQIGTSQPNDTFAVQGSKAWLDAGSTFVIKQLIWENVDVKPLNQVEGVDAPHNVTVAARVYDATLRVSDYLQIPISGASATISLANGTSVTRTTGIDGTISMASIPLGRFNATFSYLGASQGISADVAAQDKQVDVRLPASLPDLGTFVGSVALAALAAYAVVRRRRRA